MSTDVKNEVVPNQEVGALLPPTVKMPVHKYRPFPMVDLPNRKWPTREITRAPRWCSVDLRDGNQALAEPMNVPQKLRLFDELVRVGFKEIEVGFPSASNTEFAFNRRLIEEGRVPDDVAIQCLVQAREDLIERTFQSLVGAKRAVVHLYNSTSPAQRRVVFGMSEEQIINVAVRGANWIKDRVHRLKDCEVILQYSPESFSATEVEFALEISKAVMDVWKPTPDRKMILNLPDTVEVAMPNVYADQIEWMCENLPNRESVIISLHTHNDRGTGTAATELGLLAGADRVEGTLFGNGERTGNLDIVNVALNLYMHGIDPGLDFSDIGRVRRVYEECTGMVVPARQPYGGELVFTAFSGSHQDAIKKGFAEWERGGRDHWDVPYLTIDPADIGREYKEVIRVNSQSGKAGVAYLLEQEIAVGLPKVFQQELSIIASEEIDRHGREVTGEFVKDIFDAEYVNANVPWKLVSGSLSTEGKEIVCAAEVEIFGEKVEVEGQAPREREAIGNALSGLIAASNLKIQVTGLSVEKRPTGEGLESVAFAQIKFADTEVVCGVGFDKDEVQATIGAVLNALNRAFPWVALERGMGITLPDPLRFEFGRTARAAMVRRGKALGAAGLEKLFALEFVRRINPAEGETAVDYFNGTNPLVIGDHAFDFHSDGGQFFCELAAQGSDDKVKAEGMTAADAIVAAISQLGGEKAEATATHVSKLRHIFSRDNKDPQGKRRSESVAYIQLRFAAGGLSWGAGFSFDAEEAILRAVTAAYNRHVVDVEQHDGAAMSDLENSILNQAEGTVTGSEGRAVSRRSHPFESFEGKWQQYWLENKTFHIPNPGEDGFDASKPKFYVMDMFPYPSGAGLHVGHPEGYTATDILARTKKMQGFNVLHPMGWDAFGLPAEQYAIKTGQHPRVTTEQNVARFKGQLQRIGFAFDWDREVNTSQPEYYKWTQWIFLKLYNSWFNPETNRAEPIGTYPEADKDSVRLAYIAEAPVNWCPALGTVLANEEVVDGKSEVGGFPVERRPMRQWMLRITAYGQRLIDELEGLDWPEGIKIHQRNWIGRSEGAEVIFGVAGTEESIAVFTTRPDTLFGATYMVLAPEHPLVEQIVTSEQVEAVEAYRDAIKSKSELERTDLAKDKTGVFTGAYAINPVNGQQIPVWIADYVMMGYGTGAIMAVPAHDSRDFEFAEKFELPIIQVVKPKHEGVDWQGYTDEGFAVNSANDEISLDGLPTAEAKATMIGWLEAKGLGRGRVQFKLRDWLFSRQRYWGEPFPIVWEDGEHRDVPENELPVIPPDLKDFKPTGTPEPPLSKAKDWVRYSETATRELNTMPQWAGSCWYYLRYLDAHNAERFVGAEAEQYWMGGGKPGGVDLYVGGTEHAVLHLLYARFWHKVLFDLGYVSTVEPFQRLVNQGLILGEDGNKMSKSRGNVVNPDDIIRDYGADALRCYEMFMGPLEAGKKWSTSQVDGITRFLSRVWRLVMEQDEAGVWRAGSEVQDVPMDREMSRVVHATIKKVGEDIETVSAFNTAIAQMMVCTNALTGVSPRPKAAVVTLIQLLNPLAPHITEELWQQLGLDAERGELASQAWPQYDPALVVEDEVEIPVQINSKIRDRIKVAPDASSADLEAAALASEKVKEAVEGKTVRKIIVVPGKLVNVIVG